MNSRKLKYGVDTKENKTNEIARKGKVRLFFDRFKNYAAVGTLITVINTSAAYQGCSGKDKEKKEETQKPEEINPLTQLLDAIKNGEVEKVKKLVEQDKVDINAAVDKYDSAIWLAMYSNRPDIVKYLINKGADVKKPSKYGKLLIVEAASKGYENIVRMLVEKKKVDVNAKDSYGETALWGAWNAGQIRIVEFLANHGADLNLKDKNGRVILIEAILTGNNNLVELFLEKGADVNMNGPDGENSLIKAVAKGYENIVEMLIDKKVDINAKDRYGETALWRAWDLKRMPIFELLVKSGADVNAKNRFGEVLLWKVWNSNRMDLVELLVNNKANVNVKDNAGRVLLVEAVKKGQTGIARILRENGKADPTLMDASGDTAFSAATKYRKTDLEEFLQISQ